MKKFLMLLWVLLVFPAMIIASEPEAYFKIGKFEALVPIKNNIQAVSLYDWYLGQGLLGGETNIAQWGRLNASFGAVTSFLGQGTPYLGLGYQFSKTVPRIASIGIFGGYDFKVDNWRIGIKSSTPLNDILDAIFK